MHLRQRITLALSSFALLAVTALPIKALAVDCFYKLGYSQLEITNNSSSRTIFLAAVPSSQGGGTNPNLETRIGPNGGKTSGYSCNTQVINPFNVIAKTSGVIVFGVKSGSNEVEVNYNTEVKCDKLSGKNCSFAKAECYVKRTSNWKDINASCTASTHSSPIGDTGVYSAYVTYTITITDN